MSLSYQHAPLPGKCTVTSQTTPTNNVLASADPTCGSLRSTPKLTQFEGDLYKMKSEVSALAERVSVLEAERDRTKSPEYKSAVAMVSASNFVSKTFRCGGHTSREIYCGLRVSLPTLKDGYQYASILAALVAPMSRGTVTLTSSDMSDLPVIDPQWLTHPVDAAVAVAAYKRVRAAFATRAMAPVLADMTEYFPGPKVATDDQVLATIRSTLMTVYHAACTCRMGLADDPTAVVDSSARVIGVQGVRVVDASAFALLPPGHPQSVVYALAEKIADRIQAGG